MVQAYVTSQARRGLPASDELSAWRIFFRDHTLLIGTVLKRCGAHKSDVEDLTQQVWVILLKRLPTWKYDPAIGTLSGYISKVACRVAGKHARRRPKGSDCYLTTEHISMLLDPGPGPPSECERKERLARAWALLARARSSLPDRTYRILAMHWIDGLSVREIAVEFQLSKACVEKILQRALHAIQSRLSGEDF